MRRLRSMWLLGSHEFRANWRRNAVFAAIMIIATIAQLAVTMVQAVTQTAVQQYGDEVLGRENTYSTSMELGPEAAGLAQLDATLRDFHDDYPWFNAAFLVNTSIGVQERDGQDIRGQFEGNSGYPIAAVSSTWNLVDFVFKDDDGWRTFADPSRKGPALLVQAGNEYAPNVAGGSTVNLVTGQGLLGSEAPAGKDTPTPDARYTAGVLHDVPVYAAYRDANKELAGGQYFALANPQTLTLLDQHPETITLIWYCQPAHCADAASLVKVFANQTHTTVDLQSARLISDRSIYLGFMNQINLYGTAASVLLLVLGVMAITIVAVAYVEVRAPQFATLRTLGTTRTGIAGICLLENLLTAAAVAALAIAAATALTGLNPNLLNTFNEVTLTHLPTPWAAYARITAIALATGLISGLIPAIKAYRAVSN